MLTCTLMLVVSIALTIGFILSIDAGLQLWRSTDESPISHNGNVQRVWDYLRRD